jgi:hypothetical protein
MPRIAVLAAKHSRYGLNVPTHLFPQFIFELFFCGIPAWLPLGIRNITAA